MARPEVPYKTPDLDSLKRKLPSILSRKVQEVSTMVRKEYPYEVTKLASVFLFALRNLHHKWPNAVLAQVPLNIWVKGPGDEDQVKPHSSASMRYLSRKPLPEEAHEELQQLSFRQELFEELVKEMSGLHKRVYRSMLRWVPHDALGDPGLNSLPLSSDTAFGHNLFYLEMLMDEQVRIYESKWIVGCGWPQAETVPAEVTRQCSRAALEYLCNVVQRWYDDSEQATGPNSLLALTSANLSVNRALLELAAIEARGREAAQMNIEFLCELNRQGVNEVPMEMERHNADIGTKVLRDLLISWFGHGGSMLDSATLFQRPMNTSDVEMVVCWSQQLQESYIRTRGGRGGPQLARAYHGSSNHLFIFAIAMVGAFYNKAKTAYEFTGHSNPEYAVFPARAEVASGNRLSPPAHAEQFLLQAYGQLFFANSGWELFADRILPYAETASIKRSHVQQLIRFATKDRASSELLVLHCRLQHVREQSDKERRQCTQA